MINNQSSVHTSYRYPCRINQVRVFLWRAGYSLHPVQLNNQYEMNQLIVDRSRVNQSTINKINSIYSIDSLDDKIRVQLQMMLTENSRNFKILKVSDSTILYRHQQTQSKFLYFEKCSKLSLKNRQRLLKIRQLLHPNIIQLRHLQIAVDNTGTQQVYQNRIPDTTSHLKIGFYIEHYASSLTHYLKSKPSSNQLTMISSLQPEQIINTFEPIINAIEFMGSQDCLPETFNPSNIVVTESGIIKYLDEYLLQDAGMEGSQSKTRSISEIYYTISEMIYKLLMPDCRLKSWKRKLKNLGDKIGSEGYSEFMKIYRNCLHDIRDSHKTKRISKQNKKWKKKSPNSQAKSDCGKQNKVIQPKE